MIKAGLQDQSRNGTMGRQVLRGGVENQGGGIMNSGGQSGV